MIESSEIVEIYDGSVINIWKDSEGYFHISFPWTTVLVPDIDTLYDILQDFRMCIEDVKMNGHLDIFPREDKDEG